MQCIKLLASVASWAPLANDSSTISDNSESSQDRYCRLYCEPRECSRNAIMLLLDLRRSGLPGGLEHIICLGLAIAVRHVSGENRTNIFDTASLAALTKGVISMENPSLPDSEVIIWISLLVNWRTQSTKPVPKANELLDYVLDSFPAARTWKKVSVICRKFWWFDRFKSEWEQCWSRGIARQRERQLPENARLRNREGSIVPPLPRHITHPEPSVIDDTG